MLSLNAIPCARIFLTASTVRTSVESAHLGEATFEYDTLDLMTGDAAAYGITERAKNSTTAIGLLFKEILHK